MKDGWDKPPELERLLERYIVPPPPDAARERALSAALQGLGRPGSMAWSLLRQIRVEVRFLPLWYYAASLALALAGAALLLASADAAQRLGLLMGLTPLPLLLGLAELFHGADQGMAELEAACRFSPSRVLSARMLIIGSLSCVIALLMGLCARCLPPAATAAVVTVPFCLSAATGLGLSMWLQGRAETGQVAAAVALLNGGAAWILCTREKLLEAFPASCHMLLTAGSALLLAAVIRRLLRTSGNLYERMMTQWN